MGEERGWAGWAEMPQVREGSPDPLLGSGLNQTPARALGELLLCTHMQGHVRFQHDPPISRSTQKPLACEK